MHHLHAIMSRLMIATIFIGMPLKESTLSADDLTPGSQRSVPYLTIRNHTGSADVSKYYGTERGSLSSGRCEIREFKFDVLAPAAKAAPFYIPEEILRVDAIRELPVQTFLDDFQNSLMGTSPVLYTHGFNIDFEKGCRRATVLMENARLEGRFLWFSWPSDGSLLSYASDETDLYWSAPDLADTIIDLASRFSAGKVNVVGHSLGARGVTLALADIATRNPDIRLGEVALIAADMDFGLFQKLLPRIRPIARGITLYISHTDRPLAISAKLHEYPRLGETNNDVTSLAGVEVINVSDLPVRSASGHLYHIRSEEVGEDLAQLLQGYRANSRERQKKVTSNVWMLQSKMKP